MPRMEVYRVRVYRVVVELPDLEYRVHFIPQLYTSLVVSKEI